MKNWKTSVKAVAWSALALLLIPALWYSLRTPFALIDDYGHWCFLPEIGNVSGFFTWLFRVFFHSAERFRITFDLYQLATWAILGENSSLHHGLRWVMKAVVVWSGYKILRLLTPAGRSATGLPFWVFCVVYIFFPNNPEARLGPQEVITVFFLALLLYELVRLLARAKGDLAALSLGRYLWLLFVFTAMIWAKEPDFLLALVAVAFLACMNLKRWVRLVPFVIVIVITAVRLWQADQAGGYGRPTLTWNLVLHNFVWYSKCLFLCKTSLICTFFLNLPFLVGGAWLVNQTWKTWSKQRGGLQGIVFWVETHPDLACFWLVVLNFLAYYVVVITSWMMVVRYFYPLVFLLALWIGLALVFFERYAFRWRMAVTGILIAGSLFFIGANYYNFIYQFACQYYTRDVEQDVLRSTEKLLQEGRTVTMTLNDEFDYSMGYYFNQYLPYYKKTNYRIMDGPPAGHCADGCYYVTKIMQPIPGGLNFYRQFYHCYVSRILSWCERISTFFQFGRPAFIWVDPGASSIGPHGEEIGIWYIYDCRNIRGFS